MLARILRQHCGNRGDVLREGMIERVERGKKITHEKKRKGKRKLSGIERMWKGEGREEYLYQSL